MVNNPQRSLAAKYKRIFSFERTWAASVARSIFRQRPISVWEFMMPVVLIFGFARSKSRRELFVQNLLFTKELALKAALEMIKSGKTKDEAMSSIEKRTRDLLASIKDGMYSEEIRQMQLKEVGLLIDHYLRLFQVEGEDSAALVRNAYQSPQDYRTFLEELKGAEKEVNRAALQTLGSRGNPELVSRMEQASDGFRKALVQQIFAEFAGDIDPAPLS